MKISIRMLVKDIAIKVGFLRPLDVCSARVRAASLISLSKSGIAGRIMNAAGSAPNIVSSASGRMSMVSSVILILRLGLAEANKE